MISFQTLIEQSYLLFIFHVFLSGFLSSVHSSFLTRHKKISMDSFIHSTIFPLLLNIVQLLRVLRFNSFKPIPGSFAVIDFSISVLIADFARLYLSCRPCISTLRKRIDLVEVSRHIGP